MTTFGYGLLPLVIVLIGCSSGTEKPGAYTKHTNRSEAFSLQVPAGWTMQDTSYTFMFREDVFGLARNDLAAGFIPSIPWEELPSGSHSRRWRFELTKRLPPGGAIVLFYHFEGGPLIFCNFLRDTVGESLASVVDTLRMDLSNPFHFGFSKWGNDWQIEVLTRDVTRADRQAIRDLLRSITFDPVPVVTEGQAMQLAYNALPLEVQGSGDPCKSECLMVDITESGGIFEARFRPCQCCGCGPEAEEPPIEGEWRYLVYANGVVEAVDQ